MLVGFFIVGLILIISALGVVFSKNLFHSVLYLALMLFSTAMVYLMLGAELVAGIQVLLYTGGVVTLFVFAIMLTRKIVGEDIRHTNRGILLGILAGFIGLFVLSFVLASTPAIEAAQFEGNILLTLSRELFLKYALPFEVLSVLLVAAIIGALVISRKEE